jgi:hypothetical protein
MVGAARILLGIFAITQLIVEFSQAAEPVRLAFSDKLGVTIFAYPDGSGEWCRAKLGVSILVKDDGPLLSQGVDGLLSKFGAMFAEKCPAATSATIAVYKASDRSQIGKSFTVAKVDNWSRSGPGQPAPEPVAATAPPPAPAEAPAAAPPQPAACDHSPVAADYFVAACTLHGLEFRRQSDGLEAARTRQADAGKALQCTPQSMTKINDMSTQVALRIVNSGTISALMDFADGMRVECKKAASDLLK